LIVYSFVVVVGGGGGVRGGGGGGGGCCVLEFIDTSPNNLSCRSI